MKLLPYGERAVLVELDDPRQVPAMRAALAGRADVVDAVAGAATVLAVFARAVPPGFDPGELADAHPEAESRSVTVRVVYDGADLAEVASQTGLSEDEVVARHCAGDYVVRFCGFSPGFAYLDGLDERLHVSRHAEPRTEVPAGSVAIAGGFTGVYPRASPGGWRLLGRTHAVLWDVTRDPPALLTPGSRVRFAPE
jgi:KipI family sensor histidine kinase inhibitor